jgi:hypothetical protein
VVTNEKGVLHIPLLIALFFITFSGFRIWGILRNWRFLVETQFHLDRCVGEVAQQFRGALNSLEASNVRIAQLRVAIQLAELEPWLIPPLRGVLGAQVAQQELVKGRWQLTRARWFLHGCGKMKDTTYPLPALNFVRDLPDLIGPQALHWKGVMPENFKFQVSHRSRHAAARVEEGGRNGNSQWRAYWSPFQKLSWASFP